MKNIILPVLAILYNSSIFGQNEFKAVIKDSLTNEFLIGSTAFLKGTNSGSSVDLNGKITIKGIPEGIQTIVFSYIGYETKEEIYNFPMTDSLKEEIIFLKSNAEELEEIVVSTTRTSRTIQNTPTRVETIELEEIDEKSNMRPSNVSMLLHESTGIQVQQTSATSANASIRIQGLDGRYTQLLKDGYPNFGNFASGLSILEIPPLDLKQVEVLKGPASTLYGGGAIAGVVNFISKTPKKEGEYNFLINQSLIGQTNIGAFASRRKNKIGYTFLALGNLQTAYDVDKDDFTELPKSTDFTIHPKLFFYPTEKLTLIVGNSFTKGERTGGDILVIQKKADTVHSYFEKNNTLRNSTTLELEQKLKDKNQLTLRTSLSIFKRDIYIPNYSFKGINYNSFTDIAYVHTLKNQTIIVGGNFVYDKFKQTEISSFPKRNFTSNTSGVYVQHTWDISDKLKIESGIRADAIHYKNHLYSNTEYFVLPRASALFKFSEKISSRIGGGLGYKAPTIFTEQTEAIQYKNVLPLNAITSEKSYGGTVDLNFKTAIREHFYFAVNQLFFYTIINNATVLKTDTLTNLFFVNAKNPVESKGFETNLKLIFKENFKLFVGYTFTNAKANYLTSNQNLLLVPQNKLNLALVYEKEKKFKLGLEGYFTDQQYLSNGMQSPSFWEFGAMVEKTVGKFSVYINAENFTDTRQSRYKRVVNEPHNTPSFDDIWTHTEGFVLSGGIKIKL